MKQESASDCKLRQSKLPNKGTDLPKKRKKGERGEGRGEERGERRGERRGEMR